MKHCSGISKLKYFWFLTNTTQTNTKPSQRFPWEAGAFCKIFCWNRKPNFPWTNVWWKIFLQPDFQPWLCITLGFVQSHSKYPLGEQKLENRGLFNPSSKGLIWSSGWMLKYNSYSSKEQLLKGWSRFSMTGTYKIKTGSLSDRSALVQTRIHWGETCGQGYTD